MIKFSKQTQCFILYIDVIKLMKSISIVYKRPKTIKETNHEKIEEIDMRKSTNGFYEKLIQKRASQDDIMQKVRSQTARTAKIKDRKNVISSLSIAAIATPQPNLSKSNTERKTGPNIMFSIKKPKNNNFFTLKLSDHYNHHSQKLELALSRKNTKQLAMHAKIKLLSKIKCQKQVTFVISIDFIYNEHNFWSEENIQESAVRTWKMLQPLANIIWLVRSEETYKKLIVFTQNKGLRLDGVIQSETNKKQSLTISYASLEQQIKFHRSHKLLIINALKSSDIDNLGQYQFRSSLPIIGHSLTFVHFIPIDMSNRNRLNQIKKVITEQLPKPYRLHQIFQNYRERKGKHLTAYNSDKQKYVDQLQLLSTAEQLQKTKQNLLHYFDQSFGLKSKLECGDSLTYIIGDMIKRNYNIAKQIKFFNSEITDKRENQSICLLQRSLANKMKKFQYYRPVYVWDS